MTSGRPRCAQQQDVERRVGQHRAEVALAGRDVGGDGGRPAPPAGPPSRPPLAAPPRQLDRAPSAATRATRAARWDAPARSAAPPLPRSRGSGRAARSRSPNMTASGLCGRRLRCLEAPHDVAVGRVAGQMEAAEPLDGEDLAVAQQLGGRADGGGGVVRRCLRPAPTTSPLRPVPPAARVPSQPQQPHRAARRPGRRWARRGSAGRRVLVLRAGRPGTAGSAAWWCARGRTAGPR